MASASPSNGRMQIAGLCCCCAPSWPPLRLASIVTPAPCGSGLGLSSDQISQRLAVRNAERAQHLHNFESQRQYTLDYTGFPSSRSAEMKVKVYYHAPGTKTFTVSFRSRIETDPDSRVPQAAGVGTGVFQRCQEPRRRGFDIGQLPVLRCEDAR